MGRSIKSDSDKAIKNRARVRKSRLLKKKRTAHENHIQEQIDSLKDLSFETGEDLSSDIDENSINGESDDDLDSKFSCDDVDESIEFIGRLRSWAVKHRITHSAIRELLAILIFGGLVFLPKDSRTFMKTPAKIEVVGVSNGKLWYHSVGKSLENVLCKIPRDISLTLDFSFDGLPIFKSSNTQFWPMLSSIQGIFSQLKNSLTK